MNYAISKLRDVTLELSMKSKYMKHMQVTMPGLPPIHLLVVKGLFFALV